MDPRAKLLLAFVFIGTVLIAQSFWGLLISALFTAAFFTLAHIPVRTTIATVMPLFFVVVITALFNIFFIQGDHVLFKWSFICISKKGLMTAAFMSCRLTLLLLGMSLLTLTTTTLELTDAFEHLLHPATRIGVPAHELSMMMGITLRFLPQLTLELQAIRRAQLSRGASISKGRIRLLTSLIIPLFTSSFRHAEALSTAMDARCYHGGEGRTHLSPLQYSKKDGWGIVVVLLMLICVVATNLTLP